MYEVFDTFPLRRPFFFLDRQKFFDVEGGDLWATRTDCEVGDFWRLPRPLLATCGPKYLATLGLSGLWQLASRITDRTHGSVVIRRATLLYYVISFMFRKFM